MNRSLYVSADLDNIEDLIKVLKRAKKQMEELSDDGELPVEVEMIDVINPHRPVDFKRLEKPHKRMLLFGKDLWLEEV